MNDIPLAKMILALRRELVQAQKQAAKEDLKFNVEDIELELRVGTTQEEGVNGGVKFWVVNAGAKTAIATEAMQTIRLKLKPETAPGETIQISRQDEK